MSRYPRIAHWDISHFRAPYKAASVQGFGDFLHASSPALRGDEGYDFLTASSPALRGYGAVPSSLSDPRKLITILHDHFYPYYAGPDLVLELADKIAQPVGDYNAVSTKLYSAFVALFQAGGTMADAQAIIDATVAWMAGQFQKSNLEGIFVDSFVRASLKSLATQAMQTTATAVQTSPSMTLVEASRTAPAEEMAASTVYVPVGPSATVATAFGPVSIATRPAATTTATVPVVGVTAPSVSPAFGPVPGVARPTATATSPVPIVSVGPVVSPAVSPKPAGLTLPPKGSARLPRGAARPTVISLTPRPKSAVNVPLDLSRGQQPAPAQEPTVAAPPAPEGLPSWVVPAAIAGVGVVAVILLTRKK